MTALLIVVLAFAAPLVLCALVMWIAGPPEQLRDFFKLPE